MNKTPVRFQIMNTTGFMINKMLISKLNFRYAINVIARLVLALHSLLIDTQLFVSELAISNSWHFMT